MVTGLVMDGTGFEVLTGGERVGSRRPVGPGHVEFLAGLAARYVLAVRARTDGGVLAGLGRERHEWMGRRQLARLLEGHRGRSSGRGRGT